MTDDEILAIVGRRLGRVEPMVPPPALAGVQPSVGVPIGRGRPRPIGGPPVAILMLVIVAVLAVAVVQRPVGHGAAPGNSPIASASPPGETSPVPSATASISAGLEIVRGEGSGEMLILRRMGWIGICLMGSDALSVAIDPALIDRAAEAAGVEEGWVDVGEFGRFWIGRDVERAAAGIGASKLAIGDQGDPWILLGGTARRLVAFETPAGRTYWRLLGTTRPCDAPEKPGAGSR